MQKVKISEYAFADDVLIMTEERIFESKVRKMGNIVEQKGINETDENESYDVRREQP